MSKRKLLEEYVRLVVETGEVAALPAAPFQLTGPLQRIRPRGDEGEYAITRDFPLVCDPDMARLLRVSDDELENGCLVYDHEITLECDLHYEAGSRSRDWYQPDDPSYAEVEDWTPVTLDGFVLSKEDAARLKSYLGDLTDDERESITEKYLENGGAEPDFDDYDY